MKLLKNLVCCKCKSNKKLRILKKILLCKNCGEVFPILDKIPIMLTIKDDFFHVKKALLPSKYRVKRYGN